jgi:hypothetical protein
MAAETNTAKNALIMFVVVVGAVFVGMMLYDKYRAKRSGDFGAMEMLQSRQIVLGDFVRATSTAKTAMAEHYLSMGAWPPSNKEAGLPSPEAYRGNSLVRLDVSGPDIVLTFDARSGVDGGKIVLTGTATPELAMGIEWKCTSPNMPDIATILRDCVYGERPSPQQIAR